MNLDDNGYSDEDKSEHQVDVDYTDRLCIHCGKKEASVFCHADCSTLPMFCSQECVTADGNTYCMVGNNWIQNIHMKRGALSRQAKQRGMPLGKFERGVENGSIHASSRTKHRVALARTLAKFRGGSKRSK
jgi:hypothetical protein